MTDQRKLEDQRIQWVSSLLRTGVVLSALMMVVGLVSQAVIQTGVVDGDLRRTAGQLIRSILSPEEEYTPPFILSLYAGLILLMLTPVMRVVTVLISFLLEKDRRFTLVSLLVLGMLVAEILLAVS